MNATDLTAAPHHCCAATAAHRRGPWAARRSPQWATDCARLALAATVIVSFVGCADLSYKRLKLGAVPRDYDRALPLEQTRRTDLGLCYLDESKARHKTDVIVVLWTADRRIYAKAQVTYREREYGFTRHGEFVLRGAVNTELGGMAGAAAVDALRAMIVEMNDFRGERGATEAYGWVVSGLMRIVSRESQDPAVLEAHGAATDFLDRVPADGTHRLQAIGNEIQFDYRASAALR